MSYKWNTNNIRNWVDPEEYDVFNKIVYPTVGTSPSVVTGSLIVGNNLVGGNSNSGLGIDTGIFNQNVSLKTTAPGGESYNNGMTNKPVNLGVTNKEEENNSNTSNNSSYKYYTPYSQTEEGKKLYEDYMNKLALYTGYNPFAFSKNEEYSDLYNQIMGFRDFEYNLNEDALYDQYVDQYTRLGNLASQDVMGQAAALTGGYGNSYAQGVAQQQYNAYLQQLNEVVPELEGRAYNRYLQDKEDLYNQYALLDAEYNRELGEYTRDLEKLYNDATIAGDIYGQKASEYNTAWDVNNTESWKNKEFDTSEQHRAEDIEREDKLLGLEQEAAKPTTVYSGGGTMDGREVPKAIAGVQGLTTDNADLFSNGKLKEYTYSTESKGSVLDGGSAEVTWNIGGSTIKYPKGVNPYTGKANPDVKNGVMGEGNESYIPNNIAGVKIEEYKEDGKHKFVVINGETTQIYVCGGDTVAWDDVNNEWIPV